MYNIRDKVKFLSHNTAYNVLNPVLSNSEIVDLCIKELKIDEYNYTVKKIKKYIW